MAVKSAKEALHPLLFQPYSGSKNCSVSLSSSDMMLYLQTPLAALSAENMSSQLQGDRTITKEERTTKEDRTTTKGKKNNKNKILKNKTDKLRHIKLTNVMCLQINVSYIKFFVYTETTKSQHIKMDR